MQTLIIHGRQVALGRAELESLYGAEALQPVGDTATLIDKEPAEINFTRLGGMVKFAKVLTTLETSKWREIENFLLKVTPGHFASLPEGKLKIGLSVYDLDTNIKNMQATALKLKRAAKATGRSVRVVPNKELALNSASVLYNKLTHKLGWELIFVRDNDKTIVAQSIAVQDIDSYARRDQQRPFRDARVGMLPPKLAQIIINLASGKKLLPKNKTDCDDSDKNDFTVLDPFCGTGVLPQEAILMGYQAAGTDLEPRMIEYCEGNLKWLENIFRAPPACPELVERGAYRLKVADATNFTWDKPYETIACETYLGRALSSLPDRQTMRKIMSDCDTIHTKFLKNVARQTNPGFRLCIAIPTWISQDSKSETNHQPPTTNHFLHLSTLDKLNDLGYNRIKLDYSSNDELIYHRPGQIVGRELVILERK